MAVGNPIHRLDAVAKTTGKACYTDDFFRPDILIAKYFRSTIAHGRVKHIDISQAAALKGVEAVFTYLDVPQIKFATSGHPYSLDPSHKDVEDRLLLTGNVRFIGDEIAIVVAENELIADEALQLIDVEFEKYDPLVTPEKVLAKGAREIHEGTGNVVGKHNFQVGGDPEKEFAKSDYTLEGSYKTSMVHHCHLENHITYAYMEDHDSITIVSSTQIPHIVRRIVGQALSIPVGKIRVIKPYIGGGFGNKQDVVLEPMAAFLTKKLNGRYVKINLSRSEGMIATRNRHPFNVDVKLGVQKDGTITALKIDALSITGAYASHGHSIISAGTSKSCVLYPRIAIEVNAKTIYANIPVAGAMRAYGSPQIVFPVESLVEDAARKIGMDPVEFRLKNAAKTGDINPFSKKPIATSGLSECLIKGKELIGWDKKRKELANSNTGPVRRGLGVACFSYGSGTYPVCVEIAGVRIILNQDGSVHVQAGAVEIGQGSDTVIAQMVAQTIGLSIENVHIISTQDTDVTPFDPGAYASRQTYVVSNAVFEAAEEIKGKIITYAGLITGLKAETLTIVAGNVVSADNLKKVIISLKDLAIDSYYHKDRGGQITADVSHKTRTNAFSYGCTFVDLTVDIPLCKVTINEIYNIHDSGKIINPVTATGQVEGGVAMGIGAGLFETFLIDPETGRVYNNNFLDYKIPTFLDIPDIGTAFVETYEPTAAYGNKSLGEPPIISPPPAIRNAILHATGVAVNELPIRPQTLFNHLNKAGYYADQERS